jgi:hypothetical protein
MLQLLSRERWRTHATSFPSIRVRNMVVSCRRCDLRRVRTTVNNDLAITPKTNREDRVLVTVRTGQLNGIVVGISRREACTMEVEYNSAFFLRCCQPIPVRFIQCWHFDPVSFPGGSQLPQPEVAKAWREFVQHCSSSVIRANFDLAQGSRCSSGKGMLVRRGPARTNATHQ